LKGQKSAQHGKFAKALLTRRKERGYPTAYAFYFKNGGQRCFGFSYHHYLLIEKGMRLPSQPALKAIIEAMGLHNVGFYPERKELLVYYVKALLAGDPMFDPVFKAAKGGTEESQGFEAELLKTTATRQVSDVPRMSKDQAEVVTANPLAFWLLNWLLQSGTARTGEQLAKDLGVPYHDLVPPIQALLKHHLIEKKKDGSYIAPHAESDLFIPVSVYGEKTKWIADQFQKKIDQGGVNPSYYAYILMAMEDEERLAAIYNLFRDAIRKSYLLRPRGAVTKGTIIGIEARVASLMPIDIENK
jgi:hypothetical protein